jgi:two-component system, NarL family, sensor histidine kinase DevS
MEYSSDGRSAVAALTALDRVPQLARELTGARYAALAILNERGTGLEHFLTAGVDEETRRAIGHPPRGRGVLGRLILVPHPLRIADVRKHPSSYGFPEGHPVMGSFLGVPVMIRGRAWGSLHLADKVEGEFTDADEQAIVALAKDAADTIGFERRPDAKEAVT